MKLYQAQIEDFNAILAFYDDVIAHTPEISLYARWSKGKHPTEDGIKTYIKEGSMFLYKEQSSIVGAIAVTMYQGGDYHRLGFEYRGKQHLYAENTGWTDFYFFEFRQNHQSVDN